MTPLWQFIALLAVHWMADVVLQTHWQAQNKSKRNDALGAHVAVYTLVLAVGSAIIFRQSEMWVYFWTVNGILHFGTDYCTSRWSSRLYAGGHNVGYSAMNKVWFFCEGEVVPSGVFDAVVALRGAPGGDGSQCRWPLGSDVHAPDFRFCDSDALAGMVYCAHHCRISYQPKG